MPVSFVIPGGPKNIENLFPDVDFDRVESYYLELIKRSDDSAILTTPEYKKGCCCDDDTVRIFFVNRLGGIDAVNFAKVGEELEVNSQQWKKPLKTPMEKWDGGLQRFNVTSNEIVTVENRCYAEEDQDWLKELLETPNAWIQWIGTQGQDDDYIPIVIVDGKFVTRKNVERYHYVLQLQFVYANENLTLRN
jgi:hypothetical protein